MAFVNFATREITAKVVYYGPGLGGKTTSLQYIHNSLSPDNRGKMISLATEEDRTIYFDFLPLHLGKIQDFSVRVQLYTVPGQVRYNATRKLVLRGADGLVFVADSQRHKKLANIESFNNLEENLREHAKDLKDLPHILQFNKIDLPNLLTPAELNQLLNKYNVPFYETCATSGIGVLDALKNITKLVFNDLGKKALLQKKAKTTTGTAAEPYTREAPAEEKSAVVQTSSPSPDYYGSSGYTGDLVTQENPTGDTGNSYVSPEERFSSTADRLGSGPSTMDRQHDEFLASVDTNDSVDYVEPISELEEEPYRGEGMGLLESEPEHFFSYKQMFDAEGKFAHLMVTLEKQISDNNNRAALQTAKTIYTHMVADLFPKDYFLDGNESSIVFAMGMNFKRFLRFRHLLSSDRLGSPDLLFLHHFLCDLYLGLKEL